MRQAVARTVDCAIKFQPMVAVLALVLGLVGVPATLSVGLATSAAAITAPPKGFGTGSGFCASAVPGGYNLGTHFHNVYACGPANNSGTGYYVPWSGSYKGFFEDAPWSYQCTELANRFLFANWKKMPISGVGADGNTIDGKNFASTVHERYPSVPLVKNGTSGKPYLPGDIVSFRGIIKNGVNLEPDGHVAVVIASTEDASGNGTVTIMEENSAVGPQGHESLLVSGWKLLPKRGSYVTPYNFDALASATSGWKQQAAISPTDATTNGNFGSAVAISGTTLVAADGTGKTYIYHYNGSAWSLQKEFENVTASDYDHPIAISGDLIAVGDPGYDSQGQGNGNGVVRIYQQSGTTWQLAATIGDPSPSSNDSFAATLSLSGSTLFVGSRLNSDGTASNDVGEVFVYQLTGTAWTLQTTIQPPNSSDYNFGVGIATDGTTLAIGYSTAAGLGAVNLYTGSGASWTSTQTLMESGSTVDIFGRPIAVTGSALAVGDYEKGGVYLYSDTGGAWNEQGFLSPANSGAYSPQNIAFSSPSTILVGDYEVGNGTTYVYSLSGSSWTLKAKIVPSSATQFAGCGYSLGVSGTTAVIGCPSNGANAGTVYVFSS